MGGRFPVVSAVRVARRIGRPERISEDRERPWRDARVERNRCGRARDFVGSRLGGHAILAAVAQWLSEIAHPQGGRHEANASVRVHGLPVVPEAST